MSNKIDSVFDRVYPYELTCLTCNTVQRYIDAATAERDVQRLHAGHSTEVKDVRPFAEVRDAGNIARRFCLRLHRELGAKIMRQVVKRNAEYVRDGVSGVCATHDYCDANMTMDGAFLDLGFRSVTDAAPDDQEKWDVVNVAWDKAKAAGFDASRVQD